MFLNPCCRVVSRLVAGVLLFVLPAPIWAHRQWMLPSTTVFSKAESWLTVDAAISNELFYFDHVPMRVAALQVTGPDGLPVQPQNLATGKYRSTFDVFLAKPGTYRVANVTQMTFATWTERGQIKNWRGEEAGLARAVPDGAEALRVTRNNNRVEFYVTAGKPTREIFQPTNQGLEMVPVTHPNDLVAGEEATFQFLLDGKATAGLDVIAIPGGIRYRDQLQEWKGKTDAAGKVQVRFPAAGMYWLQVTTDSRSRKDSLGSKSPKASESSAGLPGWTTAGPAERAERATYVVTLEVLGQ